MYLKDGARCHGLNYRLVPVTNRVSRIFLSFLCSSFLCKVSSFSWRNVGYTSCNVLLLQYHL